MLAKSEQIVQKNPACNGFDYISITSLQFTVQCSYFFLQQHKA